MFKRSFIPCSSRYICRNKTIWFVNTKKMNFIHLFTNLKKIYIIWSWRGINNHWLHATFTALLIGLQLITNRTNTSLFTSGQVRGWAYDVKDPTAFSPISVLYFSKDSIVQLHRDASVCTDNLHIGDFSVGPNLLCKHLPRGVTAGLAKLWLTVLIPSTFSIKRIRRPWIRVHSLHIPDNIQLRPPTSFTQFNPSKNSRM